MQFGLTEEQQATKDAARRIAQERFAPRAAEIDASGEFPWDNVRVMREAGFLGMAFPEAYGGGGADHVSHLVVKEEIARMGIRGSATRELIFEDCRIPCENRLGDVGTGYKLALRTLDHTRPGVGAEAVGVAQAALDASLKYARERVVFGGPLSDKQAIAFMLADMATEIEAARLLVYRVAAMMDAGERNFTVAASQAKLYASEMAHRVVHKALQIHGGYGYMKDFPLERYYRDQRITEIYEGTSEIQRLVIAGNLLRAQP